MLSQQRQRSDSEGPSLGGDGQRHGDFAADPDDGGKREEGGTSLQRKQAADNLPLPLPPPPPHPPSSPVKRRSAKDAKGSPYRRRNQPLSLGAAIPRELVLGGGEPGVEGQKSNGKPVARAPNRSPGKSRSRNKSSQTKSSSKPKRAPTEISLTNQDVWPQSYPPPESLQGSFSSLSVSSATATTVSSSTASASLSSLSFEPQPPPPTVSPRQRRPENAIPRSSSMNESLLKGQVPVPTQTSSSPSRSRAGKKPARSISLPPIRPTSAPPRRVPADNYNASKKQIDKMDKPPTRTQPQPSPTTHEKRKLQQLSDNCSASTAVSSSGASQTSRSRSTTRSPSSRSDKGRTRRSRTPKKGLSLRGTLQKREARPKPLKSCLRSPSSLRSSAKLSVHFDTRGVLMGEYYHSGSSTASKDNQQVCDDAEVWWSDKEIDHRWQRNVQIAFLFEEPYRELLYKAFQSCHQAVGRALNERTAPSLSSVDVCFETLEQLSPARGLEAELCPAICERQAGHSRAIMDAQVFLWDEEATPCTIERVLRHQSLKRSRISQLYAQKMAEFDSQTAQDLIAIKMTPVRTCPSPSSS